MITLYKYKSDIPYSLHDMRICKIECLNNLIKLYFEDGYVECTEPYLHVNGNISIEEVDFDFCYVYLLSDNGELGEFNGKKYYLLDFLKEYKEFSFEVVDENYGYNSLVYNGYLSLPNDSRLVEMTLTIYHFGNIVYDTQNK